MPAPQLSAHFRSREPSAIRLAQIEHMKRTDGVDAVNTAIGNVSLPMHPAMQRRMRTLGEPPSPFAEGIVRYSSTVGTTACRQAFLHVIASSGFDTDGLHVQVTDGGSAAMELIVVGLCGAPGVDERPLLLIDAAYTNYLAFLARTGRHSISVQRSLGADGLFSLPDVAKIERVIERHRPAAMVVIPYDNPTGHFYDRASMVSLAKLAVKHDLWLVSDEAYRELFYEEVPTSSIWALSEADVPGISGRRVSIETASKVWNACGLRIGALVTDSEELHVKAVAENTANLCPNVIGQHIFAGLIEESHADLQAWYGELRRYYREMLATVSRGLAERLPGLIVSSPRASIYSVVDVRDIAKPGFDALDFVMFCAREGRVDVDGAPHTLLVSPMAGFYRVGAGAPNPGRTQMRIAYVDVPKRMALVPRLFGELFEQWEARR